jgi:hypothetical protein
VMTAEWMLPDRHVFLDIHSREIPPVAHVRLMTEPWEPTGPGDPRSSFSETEFGPDEWDAAWDAFVMRCAIVQTLVEQTSGPLGLPIEPAIETYSGFVDYHAQLEAAQADIDAMRTSPFGLPGTGIVQ